MQCGMQCQIKEDVVSLEYMNASLSAAFYSQITNINTNKNKETEKNIENNVRTVQPKFGNFI